MSDIEAQKTLSTRLRSYLLISLLSTILIVPFAAPNFLGLLANAQDAKLTRATPGTSNCLSAPDRSLSLRCISFSGHLYAVAEIDLRLQKIVFMISDDAKRETFPEVFADLSRAGIKPLLVTNAGIYGTDNRPLGLLISPGGKRHEANTKTQPGAGQGNFSWDSAVFQISEDGMASIVSVREWQDKRSVVAATQSGPQLASAGKVNQSFQPQSNWSYRRTAIGIDRANRRLVHLVVSREPVTLFELATFMVNELHCSEALHLDGDLSAFYIPSSPEKFLFSDPGERIVTALSVVETPTKKVGSKKPSRSVLKR